MADATNPAVYEQIAAAYKCLEEIGIQQKDTLLVINKIDALPDRAAARRLARSLSTPWESAPEARGCCNPATAVSDALSRSFLDLDVEMGVDNGRLMALSGRPRRDPLEEVSRFAAWWSIAGFRNATSARRTGRGRGSTPPQSLASSTEPAVSAAGDENRNIGTWRERLERRPRPMITDVQANNPRPPGHRYRGLQRHRPRHRSELARQAPTWSSPPGERPNWLPWPRKSLHWVGASRWRAIWPIPKPVAVFLRPYTRPSVVWTSWSTMPASGPSGVSRTPALTACGV